MSDIKLSDIVNLCKRRGFLFHASDIYGGINGFWDYGPLGIELKNNIRDAWWHDMVTCSPELETGEYLKIVGLDSSIIQHPFTWDVSGHLTSFSDPMVDCKESKLRYRADNLIVLLSTIPSRINYAFLEGTSKIEMQKRIQKFQKETTINDYKITDFMSLPKSVISNTLAPDANNVGTFTAIRNFNLMFKTEVGALEGQNNIAYLRPETAQGIFLNYKNIVNTYNLKLPFGIAQIGKAFRNEITPRNFIFRSREFEQMELEWFCHPKEAEKWYKFWQNYRYKWWQKIGISSSNIRFRKHDDCELAHYAKNGLGTVDIEYSFPFSQSGFGELEGIAHRGNVDLMNHQVHSKNNLEYVDQFTKERFIPHVIEPAAGLTRGVLAVLCNSYTVDSKRSSGMYLKLSPRIAPVKIAILPLTKNEDIVQVAQNIFKNVRQIFKTEFDVMSSIGKRYAKHDEIGTPFCITVDYETLADASVTIRNRDTTHQERVNISKINDFLQSHFN